MADYPSMPLWIDRYFGDTRHLRGPEEHGAYLLLLMEAWMRPTCSLPDDDVLLARLACCSPEQWQAIKPTVMGFWTLDKRRREWTQKGQIKERTYLEEQSAKQSHRARSGWEKRKKVNAAAMPQRCRGNAPTPTPITEANASAADAAQDLSKIIFGAGLKLLTSSGVEERQARSMLGKWRAAQGDEALLAALGKAQREGAIDPIGFVQGIFRAKKGNGNGRASRLMQMADCLDRRAEADSEVDHGEGAVPPQPLLPAVGGGRH